ncbi:MAG: hypothetical protein OEL52_01655 [Nitrosopumilus sp.]|nr:hypothetical protein [Nitrosopumilus sp.]
MNEAINEIIFLENTCKKIQQDLPNMRFVGVINQFGHLVAGGFRNDILPYVSNGREFMMYMGIVLDLNMRKDFDDALGQVNYLHSQRDKVSMISIPMGKHIVLLATEIDVDVPKTVSSVKKEFVDLKIIDANLKPIAEIL